MKLTNEESQQFRKQLAILLDELSGQQLLNRLVELNSDCYDRGYTDGQMMSDTLNQLMTSDKTNDC